MSARLVENVGKPKMKMKHIDGQSVQTDYYQENIDYDPKARVKIKASRVMSKPYQSVIQEPLDFNLCKVCGGKGRYFIPVKPGRSRLVNCSVCS